MKSFLLISITFLLPCLLQAAELDFDALFKESLQLQKEFHEKMKDEADTPAQRTLDERANTQYLHLIRLVHASKDDRLKAEFLKMEYLYLLGDTQFDFDYAETPEERTQALRKWNQYEQRLQQIQAWLDAHPQAETSAEESPEAEENPTPSVDEE